jgi:CBS domain containing-hemolysin-like protein
VVCLGISAFSSLGAGALLEFSWGRLEALLRAERRRERYRFMLERREQLLMVALVLRNLFDVVFVIAACSLFQGDLLGPDVTGMPIRAWGVLKVLAISLGGIMILGEVAPRYWVSYNAETALRWTLPVLHNLLVPLRPVIGLGSWVATLVGRVSGTSASEENHREADEEIMSAVSEAEKEGGLEEEQRDMIASIINFRDADAEEIMTPRTDMIGIPIDASVEEARHLALDKGHSRIPVYEENRDNIIGVLYAKDLLEYWGVPDAEVPPLKTIMRKPYFVPESKLVSELLRDMRQNKIHMAIVLDEYGGTAGLITIEDILEEIVGEIEDEYDPDAAQPIIQFSLNEIEVDARVHVDEINERLSIELAEDEDFETIGGFVFDHLGKVPAAGESFSYEGIRFTVLEADERRIQRVRIVVPPRSEDEEEQEETAEASS